MALEGADDALAFNSGIGAISTAVLALAKGGLKVLTTMELYSLTKTKGKPRPFQGCGVRHKIPEHLKLREANSVPARGCPTRAPHIPESLGPRG